MYMNRKTYLKKISRERQFDRELLLSETYLDT